MYIGIEVFSYLTSLTPVEVDDFAADEIEMVLEIDDVQYRESSSTAWISSYSVNPTILMGDMSLDLKQGSHKIALLWRLSPDTQRSWRSIPSIYDGFMMGRVLAVIQEMPAFINKISFLHNATISSDEWFDLEDAIEFTLEHISNVKFSYTLPTTLPLSINTQEFLYNSQNEIQARLLVDNTPYRYLSSGVDGALSSRTLGPASIVLALHPGSHAIRLQWRYNQGEYSEDMVYQVRQIAKIQNNFLTSVQIDTWSNEPEVIVPSAVVCDGNEACLITGVLLNDKNGVHNLNYWVNVQMTVLYGTITIVSAGSSIFFPNSFDSTMVDSDLYFTGKLFDVNSTLARITYQAPARWYGEDMLHITVQTQEYPISINYTGQFVISVNHIIQPPQIILPKSQTLLYEDKSVVIHGLGINSDSFSYQLPHIDKRNEETLSVILSVSCGIISLRNTSNILFHYGSGTSEKSMHFFGNIGDINAALQVIQYNPDQDFNKLQHSESLDVTIHNSNNISAATSIPISVIDVNDPSNIQIPGTVKIQFEGYDFKYFSDSLTYFHLLVHSTNGQISLYVTDGIDFIAGLPGTPSKEIIAKGSPGSIQNAMKSMVYTRETSFYGNDLISFSFSSSGNFESNDISYLHLELASNNTKGIYVIEFLK